MGSWLSWNSQVDFESMVMDMRLQAKQLEREAIRSDKDSKTEEAKAKRNLEKGLIDNARINAENAIRKKHEALNYRRLAGKTEAVSSRITTALRTKQMTDQFSNAVVKMQGVMQTLDPQNVSKTMADFEKCFEDLDVTGAYITDSLNSATAVSTPVSEVDTLLGRIAAEHNIQVQEQMGEVPLGGLSLRAPEEELKARYDQLK
jgi:charged multivesicular body protein 1